ncbi:MAG: DUF2161 family putative PD-(D/E)XK-type phosphodiesterase [Pseudomonadota bacterium]
MTAEGQTGERVKETDLYGPIKAYLEGQGYEVKGEVASADVVGCRDGDPPVIVEMKTGFSLTLFHQAVDRLGLTDAVYVAVPRGTGRGFQKSLKSNRGLCRRLGLGLILVRLKDGLVEVVEDPRPYTPRVAKRRKGRLLAEFSLRVGDPNTGGMNRGKVMTAYRQDALRCLAHLIAEGPCKASVVAEAANVDRARAIMADNHYGWFERVERGVYAASPRGTREAEDLREVIASLRKR